MSIMDEEEREYRQYMAQISKYVHHTEFEDKGLILTFNTARKQFDKDSKAAQKYGPRYIWTVKDESGIERLVSVTANSLARGLDRKLSEKPKDTDVKLHIWKVGSGNMATYRVEHAN